MFEIHISEDPVGKAADDLVLQQGDLADKDAVVQAAVKNHGLSEVEAGFLWTYKKFRRNNTTYSVIEVSSATDQG